MADWLPYPKELGMPEKFIAWRPYQAKAIMDFYDNPKPYIVQLQPTGSGKSLCYICSAVLSGNRTLILTSIKGLQKQLESDFGVNPGLVKIMGKNAYRCKITDYSCEWGPCKFGMNCGLKRDGCTYYDQLRLAKKANIVLTNYAFWISNAANILGKFDLLVCDEAHDSVNHLLDGLSVVIRRKEIKEVDIAWPGQGENYWTWLEKLLHVVDELLLYKISRTVEVIKSIKAENFRSLYRLKQKAERITDASQTKWVVEHCGDSISFDPLWPPEFAESYLFREIPKVLLTSATISPEVTKLLGIDPQHLSFTEYPSHFPIWRRPVIHVPTARIDHRIKNDQYALWLTRIDQIISKRLDRKGIIHTVSYNRRNRIMNVSEYSEFFYTHESRKIQEALTDFKQAPAPAILCSPSVVTGWDFPYEECEYQIIGKLPFPDMRRKVDKERRKRNKDIGCCFAMQNLVQACGRGMRNADDMCECLIIDDHFMWFVYKYKKFAPRWFMDAVRTSKVIPEPLPKLNRR